MIEKDEEKIVKCGVSDCKENSPDYKSGCFFWSSYALKKKACPKYNKYIKSLNSNHHRDN